LPHQRSSGLGAPKKCVQNNRVHLPDGFYLLRCPRTPSSRVWSNVCANEESTEPAESYFVHTSVLATFKCGGDCGHKYFISAAEVLQALADTPHPRPGLPVELGRAQSGCNRLGTPISHVQFREQAQRPRRQTGIGRCGHSSA
jgi:hypothetical protein